MSPAWMSLFQPHFLISISFDIPSNLNLSPYGCFNYFRKILSSSSRIRWKFSLQPIKNGGFVSAGEFVISTLKHAIPLRCGIQSTVVATKQAISRYYLHLIIRSMRNEDDRPIGNLGGESDDLVA